MFLCHIHLSVAKNTQFWIVHLLWSYCKNCKQLKTARLLPNYFKRPTVKYCKNNSCIQNIYVNPTIDEFSNVLRGLSLMEVIVLRPFTIHLGDYVKRQNGYRQKTNIFRLSWTEKSVLDKIQALNDGQSKNRCFTAYKFLMEHEQSAYA